MHQSINPVSTIFTYTKKEEIIHAKIAKYTEDSTFIVKPEHQRQPA